MDGQAEKKDKQMDGWPKKDDGWIGEVMNECASWMDGKVEIKDGWIVKEKKIDGKKVQLESQGRKMTRQMHE